MKTLAIILLLLPLPALAFPKVYLIDNIKEVCLQEVMGCYVRQHEEIFISSKIDPLFLRYVLLHELGHHLLGPDERQADRFAWWVMGVGKEGKGFREALIKIR